MTPTPIPRPIESLGSQLAADLERLMPGCKLYVSVLPGGLAAKAIHRVTGRQLVVHVGETDWSVMCEDARHSGGSAYGCDSAVAFFYREYLDYTTEHGPGTAWDYARRAAV